MHNAQVGGMVWWAFRKEKSEKKSVFSKTEPLVVGSNEPYEATADPALSMQERLSGNFDNQMHNQSV